MLVWCQALRPVALAPGSQSFPEPVGWAGATQKRALLRAQAAWRTRLFPGDFVWPLPVPGILVRAPRIEAQRLESIEPARVEAWRPVVEQAAQPARCEQQLFLRRWIFEEKRAFAAELQRGQRRSGLNRHSRSCRHRFAAWRTLT